MSTKKAKKYFKKFCKKYNKKKLNKKYYNGSITITNLNPIYRTKHNWNFKNLTKNEMDIMVSQKDKVDSYTNNQNIIQNEIKSIQLLKAKKLRKFNKNKKSQK